MPLDPLTYLLRYARCLRVGPWDCVPGLGYVCGVRLVVRYGFANIWRFNAGRTGD